MGYRVTAEDAHRTKLCGIVREDQQILKMFEDQGVEGRAVEIVRARMEIHDRIHRNLYYDSAIIAG